MNFPSNSFPHEVRKTGVLAHFGGEGGAPSDPGTPPVLIVAFSPTADANAMVRHWGQSLTHHPGPVACYGSLVYRNYGNMPELYPQIQEEITALQNELGILPQHTLLSGMSGGGSFAMALGLQYPMLAGGVLVNTGRIWDDIYRWAYENANVDPFHAWPHGLIQLASPTDFRYNEMRRDAQMFHWLGWQGYWDEFPGGHHMAPHDVYHRAFQWLLQECWAWGRLTPLRR